MSHQLRELHHIVLSCREFTACDQSLFNGGTLQTYLQSGKEKALPPMTALNSRHTYTVKSWMDSNTNDGTP